MEILDSENQEIALSEIRVNDEEPSLNPLLVCACAISDQISLAFKSLNGETEVFVFDTHIDGIALHNNTKLSRHWPGAHCGTAAGQTFSEVPTLNLCEDGSFPPVYGGIGEWTWTCEGIGDGDPVDCTATAPVDGVCGSSHGQAFTTAPSTNLCNYSGTTPSVTGGEGPWAWTCTGTSGGQDANCAATVRPIGDPDLRHSGVSGLSSSYFSGQNLNLTVTVSNQGNASSAVANACTNGQIAVKIFEGGILRGTQYVNDIAAGEQQAVTFSFQAGQACGIHQYCPFIAEVDAGKCVAESNEGNNIGGRVSLRSR
jgi:hypothetical protein